MATKHLIMGTAGHVDHGKTSLIKTLTGYDCDTHSQEKKRGITINLGFTHLDLPNKNSIGIVDVPGHADFIATMVSGASGIDFVLFVISAEEGIMPQTIEHFEIMKMLGIKKGIIALTKSDLVDEELLELAIEEVREFLEDSFLENSEIIPVSSATGAGINDVIKEIENMTETIEERQAGSHFRMYIDRIFSVEGHGTIVNGSVLNGKVNTEDNLFLLPSKKEVRVRRIEKHGNSADLVKAGDRASFNLVGLRKAEFQRGMMLSDKEIEPTSLIDVKLKMFPEANEIGLWGQVIFLSGTVRTVAKIHLLDSNNLQKGEEGLAQIYLSKEIITEVGDHFIIRNSSGDLSIGGGEIIDPYPLHHRRRRSNQIDNVRKIASGDMQNRIEAEIKKSITAIMSQNLANILHIKNSEMNEILSDLTSENIMVYPNDKNFALINMEINKKIRQNIMNSIYQYHKENPLIASGRTFSELMGVFGKNQSNENKILLKIMLNYLVNENRLKIVDQTYSALKHDVVLGEILEKKIKSVLTFIEKYPYKGADEEDIIFELKNKDFPDEKMQQIIKLLAKKNEIKSIQKKWFSKNIIDDVRSKMIDFLKSTDEGITLAQFRDLISTNRASALIFLEFFDQEGITNRRDNARFLRINYEEKLK